MKLFIAVPAYGGSITNPCVDSLLKLQATLTAKGIGVGFQILDIGDIAAVRSFFASRVLEGDDTHLLFIDSDMTFPPKLVLSLIDANKPLAGYTYPTRTMDNRFVLETRGNKPIGIGLGLCLVSRRCLQQIEATGKLARYRKHIFHTIGLQGDLLGFFDPISLDGGYPTEDLSFCYRWREWCGGEVTVLASDDIGHVGVHVFRRPFPRS